MSNQPQHITIQTESNGLGTAGFVVSLLGFLTCGLICPLGLVLSFFGLFSRPKGLAIAGTALGAIGSLWLWLGGLALFLALIGVNEAAKVAEQQAREQSTEPVVGKDIPTSGASEIPGQSTEPVVGKDIPTSGASEIPGQSDDEPSFSEDFDELAGASQGDDFEGQTENNLNVGETDQGSREEESMADDSQAGESDQQTPDDGEPGDDPGAEETQAELRWHTFSDSSGRFSVEAQLVSMGAGKVTLHKRDGSEVTVPVERLSDDDQAWIREEVRSRQ